ncbi:MAG: succinate dehydrogenase/fumarate reductase-like Fe-S protein, partial [Bacillariaceae sp.]
HSNISSSSSSSSSSNNYNINNVMNKTSTQSAVYGGATCVWCLLCSSICWSYVEQVS